jgi:chromosome segregation ATPase
MMLPEKKLRGEVMGKLGYDDPYAEVARLEAEVERLRSDRDSLLQDRDEFSENLSAAQCHLTIAVAGEGFYEQFKQAERERDEAKHNYEEACQTIAKMHEAAMGSVCGPVRGVVEDVADVRAALAEARAEVERLTKLFAFEVALEIHEKHPTGDYCSHCRAQWPCEEGRT